jgi:hypothetical protein
MLTDIDGVVRWAVTDRDGVAASPFFTCTGKSDSMFHQEALAKVPLPKFDIRGTFVTGSLRIAEMRTSVKGEAGAFSDRTGLTFTVGVGTLLGTLPNGARVEGFVQWRGTEWNSVVSITRYGPGRLVH